MEGDRTGLEDPRALDILTTEHWSLISTRTLGYQEMFCPDLKPFFVSPHEPTVEGQSMPYGSSQRFGDLARSLTTTSSVVATLNSALAGALAMDIAALADVSLSKKIAIGATISIVSGLLHVRYAARYRKRHSTSGARSSS